MVAIKLEQDSYIYVYKLMFFFGGGGNFQTDNSAKLGQSHKFNFIKVE